MSSAPASGDPLVGLVSESHPPQPCAEIEIDASLVLAGDHVALGQVVRQTSTSACWRELERGEVIEVHKRGFASGLTSGLLEATPESLVVEIPTASGETVEREYVSGYFVYGEGGPFARMGDSGSAVIDDDDCVVGMVVGLRSQTPRDPGPEDPAFMIGIGEVLRALDIQLLGPDRACTLAA